MRILLAAPHRYPAFDSTGSGLHPREYPSGSGYHLHDLLARGLAEEGHEVFYYVAKGCVNSLPPGVTEVKAPIAAVDVCHAPIGPPGFAESIVGFAAGNRKPCLLTCHMKVVNGSAESSWIFVSRGLAQAHGSARVVLNGINPDDLIFSETKEDYLLFMGAMYRAREKGLDVALELARRAGIRLIVAGTGLDYETIRCVSELCADAGAEYVGDVRGTQKAELIGGARALLFPSRLQEGCPLVVLESMFSGTPVISSRCGGTVEIVTPETGILCESDEDWITALARVGDISPHRCREVAWNNYHYKRMVRDYEREYRAELDRWTG